MEPFDEFTSGDAEAAVYVHGVGWGRSVPDAPVALPGSFRPLHRAHRELIRVGHAVAGGPGRVACFELSVSNVEKPNLPRDEVLERVGQFNREGDMVVLTRRATFLGKSEVLPNATFVIGYDTAVRLFDERFYRDATRGHGSAVEDALRTIRANGCSFVVGGRHSDDGRFMTWDDFDCPKEFRGMFTAIPKSDFCDTISSTQVRSSL